MNDFHFEERPYQTTAVQEVLAEFAAGRKSVLLESPVGSGKTVMGLMIIREMQANSRTPLTVNWVASRKHILDQTRLVNEMYFHCDLRYVSVFSSNPPRADMIVLDEAHHEATQSCVEMYEKTGNSLILGLSATPMRTDRMRLSFQCNVECCGIQQLIHMGVLSPYDSYRLPVWDLKFVEKIFCENPEKWGKTIAFFSRIDECHHFRNVLESAGIRCEVVTGSSNKDKQLDLFVQGDVQVVANVSVLTEGFDLPELQSVFLRDASRLPTIQMVGRGLRKAPGKTSCAVVQSSKSAYPAERIAAPRQSFRYMKNKWLSCGGDTQIILDTVEKSLQRLEKRGKLNLEKKHRFGPFVREVRVR